ncbi:hypothetical protein HDE_05475 [Halotydeus destructor]|nr:hypothetical protein HDE_05475 [Halotydeus destructor]
MAVNQNARMYLRSVANYLTKRNISTSSARYEIREIRDTGFAPKYKEQYLPIGPRPKNTLVQNSTLVQYAAAGVFIYWAMKVRMADKAKDTKIKRRIEFERREEAAGRGLPKPVYHL